MPLKTQSDPIFFVADVLILKYYLQNITCNIIPNTRPGLPNSM